MNVKYITFTGKHPAEKKEIDTIQIPLPRKGDYVVAYSPKYLKLDIDDFNHKTGQLESLIHEKARSEVIVAIIDSLDIKYNGIKTEREAFIFPCT